MGKSNKTGFSRYNIDGRVFFRVFTFKCACIITGKWRASIRGKLHHCQTVETWSILCVISVIVENIPHAYHEIICIQWKSSRFLSPVSTVSPRNAWDNGRRFEEDTRKKKKTLSFLESRSAKASSTTKENVGMNYVKLPSTKLKMRLDGFIHQTGKYVRILGLGSHKPRPYCCIWFGLDRTSWKSILPVNEHRRGSLPLSLFVVSLSASRLFPGGKHNTSILWRNYLKKNRVSLFECVNYGGVFLCILALFPWKNCKLLTALHLSSANNKKRGFNLHRHAIYPRRRHKRHA